LYASSPEVGHARQPDAHMRILSQYLVYSDLQPLMESILLYHPGLEFLKETAEFQKKYAETVIYRIFFSLNRCVPILSTFSILCALGLCLVNPKFMIIHWIVFVH
jgi:hypothetical protein